jgi:ABC-type phosphate/phosphonate transport system substrate-binding protein
MVQGGAADVAAIDCVTHALLSRYRREVLVGTRVMGWSDPAPAIPYVTRVALGEDTLARSRAAVARAIADPGLAAAREALLIADVEILPGTAYRRITEFQRSAARRGFAKLH